MTQTELSALLTALDGLGERLDDRINRVEDKVDEALRVQSGRLATLEASDMRRSGAKALVGEVLLKGVPVVSAIVAVAALFINHIHIS